MADSNERDDSDDREAPSLELPSLRLRRRRPKTPPATQPAPDPAVLFTDETTGESADESKQARWRPRLTRPSGPAAAAGIGAVVGLLGVGLTWLLLGFCGLVTGTSSCGNPGLLLLLVAVLALGAVGGLLLAALGVQAPGSTSALGIGLLTVVAILFFGDALFSRWMTLVLPVLSAASYTAAHLVTAAATNATEI